MKTLQNRLIFAFLSVIVLTLLSISGMLFFLLNNTPQRDQAIFFELNTQTRLIARAMRPPSNNTPRTFTQLTEIAETEELRLAWANSQKQILYDSAQIWGRDNDIFAQLRKQSKGHWVGAVQENQRRWLVIAYPLNGPNGLRGYLLAAKPATSLPYLQQLGATMVTPLVQAGALAFALSIILATLISRSIAQPLRKVAMAAHALSTGNLEARAPVEGPQEIQAVAQTFNTMAQRVQSSQQTQRDLVANVAHDLRTPLTSIQGFAQALVDGTAATMADQNLAAQAIHQEAQRMHRLTRDLLDLARFEAGEIQLQQTPINLNALIEERARHFQIQAAEAGIQLSVTAASQLTVRGDAGRLEQVLDNLLNNALRHTPPNGRISVELHKVALQKTGPDGAEITVTDTGNGIPAEALPRIFERFYRGDRSRKGGGTGLGLSIAQEIVNAHGGEIKVESVIDVGSKFSVWLPREENL